MNLTPTQRRLPLVHSLLISVALVAACGGDGGGANSPAPSPVPDTGSNPPAPAPAPTPTPTPAPAPVPTPSPPPPSSGSYSVAARIAEIRAHASYGAEFRSTRNTYAPNGLALPTPPNSSCMSNVVTVSSLADFNREAAGSCKRIVLAAGSHTGQANITGQDIEAVFTGSTITPSDGGSFALQITMSARRVKTIGGSFNNGYFVWAPGNVQANFVQDVHIYGGSFVGHFTQGLSGNAGGEGGTIKGHRVLLERSDVRAANGAFFIEAGSTNVILANANLVVPKLRTSTGGTLHENPVRFNGVDLGLVLDSRLRTELGPGDWSGDPYIKHTWRTHAGHTEGMPGGRILIQNVQSEGGGATGHCPGPSSPHAQSTYLVVDGWRYYRAPGVEGNNVANFPYVYGQGCNGNNNDPNATAVANTYLLMRDNIVYFNDQPAGSSLMTSNVPPGSVTSSVYANYVAPPAWSFR